MNKPLRTSTSINALHIQHIIAISYQRLVDNVRLPHMTATDRNLGLKTLTEFMSTFAYYSPRAFLKRRFIELEA